MTWADLQDFILLDQPSIRYVVIGVMLISASTAVVGGFLFLRKQSLVGDAVAHAVLPGVCVAYMLFHDRSPWLMLSGAIVSGWASLLFIDAVTRSTRIKSDAAIGIALSWFFAIGMLLLSFIQSSGAADQSGLDRFLFGNASAMLPGDLQFFSWVALAILCFSLLLFRPLKLIIFDEGFARSTGISVPLYDTLLSLLMVVAIASGIQAVGVVLMAALLITPPAAARFWTDDLRVMLLLSAIFGLFSGWSGAFISYQFPRMPTGPWVVVVASALAIFSFLFGKSKGYLVEWKRHQRISQKVIRENILKALFQLSEHDAGRLDAKSRDQIANRRHFLSAELDQGLKQLRRMSLIEQEGFAFRLSPSGLKEGARITRLHRLWEIYLTKYVKVAPDHVHDDAEAIEHIITPEIEAELVRLLERPEFDPHDTAIPYPDQL